MTDLSALAPITTAATALAGLVLVTPNDNLGYQPILKALKDPDALVNGLSDVISLFSSDDTGQPPPILFHYEGEQSVIVESDITDHYVEDNTAVQDHISLKPIIVRTLGYIGELNDVPPAALAILKSLANKLTAITAYTPEVSETATFAYNEAFFLYQNAQNVAKAAVSAWSSIFGNDKATVIGDNGLPGFNLQTGEADQAQNEQQTVFQQFFGYWQARKLFRCQTPWALFDNMAITSMRASQAGETKVISGFEMTFKQIRKASSLQTEGTAEPNLTAGQLTSQSAGESDNGTSSADSDDASQSGAINQQETGG